LLDVTRLVWRRWKGLHPTGIDRVCLAYLRHYGHHAQAVIQHRHVRRILDEEASNAIFELLSEGPPHFRRAFIGRAARFGMSGSQRGNGRLYLNIGHTGLHDPGFRSWVGRSDVRPVYFIHDLIPITHPEFCRAGERSKHEERMVTVLGSAVGVIGNSKATLEDLMAFANKMALPCPPAIAALLGSDAVAPSPAERIVSTRPNFVVLGTIEARKNHLMLFHVWSRLAQRLGEAAPHLLVIGQRGWESEQAIDLLERSESLKGAVTEIGGCGDSELSAHLMGASALLFPSLVEGYGLPLVEALRVGTPVIASDLPVFHEIAGDVPDYLDPLDGPGWERAILSYAEEKASAREAQLRRLAGYRAPTWKDHFARVDDWLSRL
jgi:glycosyltransferase involved in cell wall biosynthesis